MILETAIAVEISPRPKPSSCETGFRKTPAANTLIAPCPTTSATADAATIDHLFCRTVLLPMIRSFLFPLRLGGFVLLVRLAFQCDDLSSFQDEALNGAPDRACDIDYQCELALLVVNRDGNILAEIISGPV